MRTRKVPRTVPPGDDVCPAPAPVDEQPPADRFCDLVLTGGVASGVVYPWAIVELARVYRFRNIGGTSVGAMAAALAAAAEYGRRTGVEAAFEPLRLTPAALGEELPDGRTRMLSLFQPAPRGKRLIELWGRLGRGAQDPEETCSGPSAPPAEPSMAKVLGRWMFLAVRVYWKPCAWGGAVGAGITGLLSLWCVGVWTPALVAAVFALALVHAILGASGAFVWAVLSDLKYGVAANQFGLCKGGTLEGDGPEGERPGLTQWLHEGIQASAGFEITDRPLTFRDLWDAPAFTGAPHGCCSEKDPADQRAINLEVITTNVTHGRPYRLPLADATSRLFFRPEDLKDYFPDAVIKYLVSVSAPYEPRTSSDPAASDKTVGFFELPGADLPVVVAARLSLSFPLLFSSVPLWAIDYEQARGERGLKCCHFTDGGVSSNFPIHLFDAALPRWPTFGMWLERRNPHRFEQAVWLPQYQGQGWGDNWNRFNPQNATPGIRVLSRFMVGIATSAMDWRDRTSFRLPHVRNRVARLLLLPTEGGLHIGMSRQQILRMAHRYGTAAGELFVKTFAEENGEPSPAWREQRWVRLQLLIDGMREQLDRLRGRAQWAAYTMPIPEAIDRAAKEGPVRDQGTGNKLDDGQAQSLHRLLAELEQLETMLHGAPAQPFKPRPRPELRLRAPL